MTNRLTSNNQIVENRKISLETAVGLREKLDREIHENYQILVSKNSVLIKGKHKYNLRELLRLTEVMEIQVIRLKESIQQANLKTHPWDKHSNAYYIYRLSQLKIQRDNFMKMSTSEDQGKRKIMFTSLEINDKIKYILEEIDKITQKLSKFNTLKKNEMKIQFEDDLLYLLS